MYPPELIEYVTKRTHYKARQVVRRAPALGEVKDIQHNLIEDVLRRLPKFDGRRAGVKTFICRIIDNKIASILKRHDAACRRDRCANESLDDWVYDETGAWARRGLTLEESRGRAHLGVVERSDHQQRELEMDTAAVMASLPPRLRGLCAMLRAQTPSAVSRRTSLSRSVVYRHIAAIRAVFLGAGLQHYL